MKYGLPLVDVFARTVLVAGEMKEIVGDAAHTEIANLDGGVEDAHLDADADGVARLLVKQTAGLLDTLDALLGFERDVVPLLGVLDAVRVVVGHKLELGGVLVTFVRVRTIDDDTVLLSL